MIQHVYLSDYVVDALSFYGTLDEVVNKILTYGAAGSFDLMDKPKAPDKTGGSVYKINVLEPNYLELLDTFGASSSRISLRRLLYWFVDNEIYAELDWNEAITVKNEDVNKQYEALSNLQCAAFKVYKQLPQFKKQLEAIKDLVREIEEAMWYEK